MRAGTAQVHKKGEKGKRGNNSIRFGVCDQSAQHIITIIMMYQCQLYILPHATLKAHLIYDLQDLPRIWKILLMSLLSKIMDDC